MPTCGRQPANLVAAAVAVDPRNGEVRAYYGGEDGTRFDDEGSTPSTTRPERASGPPGYLARRLGIRTLGSTKPPRTHHLPHPFGGLPTGLEFDRVTGYGPCQVTVLDQANSMATLAYHDVYHQAHFVRRVERTNRQTARSNWSAHPSTGVNRCSCPRWLTRSAQC